MPRSMQRLTTSARFLWKVTESRSAPSQLPPWNALSTTLSTRFQCPPRQTAETINLVLPQRRYSMSGL